MLKNNAAEHPSTWLKASFRRAAICGLVVTTAAVVGPVRAETGEQRMGDGREDTSTYYTFPGTPKIALSRNGNIVRYEGPEGYEHFGIGAFSEGYVLCYNATQAYDIADDETGFLPSTISCAASKCTITRNTTDGKLQLKQVIVKNAPYERSVNVEMTLTNKSQSAISNIILRRQVDFDVDTGGRLGSGSFVNYFGASERDSVFGWNAANNNPAEDHAMMIRRYNWNPRTITALAKVTGNILDSSCSPVNIAADGPVRGDYGATI